MLKGKLTGAAAAAVMLGTMATPVVAMAATKAPTVSIYGISAHAKVNATTQAIKIPTSTSEVSHLWVNGKYVSADKITSKWTYYTVTLKTGVVNLISAQVVDKTGGQKSRVEHKYVTVGAMGNPTVSMSNLKPNTNTQTLTVNATNDQHINLWVNGHWISGKYSNGLGTRTYNVTLKPGRNVVTAESVYGSKHSKYDHQIVNVGEVKSVKATSGVKDGKLALAQGDTSVSLEALNAAGNPVSNVSWKSSDSSVATVTTSGKVVAVGAGSATITVTGPNGNSATFKVTVAGAPASVKLSTASSTIVADGAATDKVTADVVDSNGNLVPTFNGNVTLTTTGNATAVVDPSNSANSAGTETVQAVNGVATFTVVSTGDAANLSDTLTATADSNSSALTAGQATVSTVAAKAQTVKLSASPSTLNVNQSGLSTKVNISVLDQAGNTYSGVSEPVTLTLSGPGSFQPGASVSSTSLYVDGTGSVYVYGQQNGIGTITVNATSGTLQSMPTSIHATTVGAPAKLQVTPQAEKTSDGTPFTLYTVQLEDANGNAITGGTGANDTVELSDNTSTTGGTLNYYSYDASTGQPGAALPMTTQLSNGQLQFAVENTSAGSVPATITVKDISENPNFSMTAPYTFQVGSADTVSLSPSNSVNVIPGQQVTYTAQLTDSNGNDIMTAGQNVNFYFNANSAKATLPNGYSAAGSSNGYTAVTNANGVATVTVTVPSGAMNGETFNLDAQVGTNSPVLSKTDTVVPLSQYATGMEFSQGGKSVGSVPTAYGSWPTNNSVTAGASYQPYISLTNGVGEVAGTNDQIEVTTSNPQVLSFGSSSAWTAVSGTNDASYTATTTNGTIQLPKINTDLAGSATITVKDLSNTSITPLTETLSVNPSTSATGATVLYNGMPISASNPLTVQADTPVQLTVEQTGAGGNPVMVTGSAANFNLSAPGSDTFRLSANGSNVSSVQIPVGSDAQTVYLVSPTAATYTGSSLSAAYASGTKVGVTNAVYTDSSGNTVNLVTNGKLSGAGTIPVNTTLQVSGQATDTAGNGIPYASITLKMDGVTQETTANANGYYQVEITPTTTNSSVTMSVYTPGLDASNGQATGSSVSSSIPGINVK